MTDFLTIFRKNNAPLVMAVIAVAIVALFVLGNIGFGGGTLKTELEAACISSGGTIEHATVCTNYGYFTNNCISGINGCTPSNSHSVESCKCGVGKCFNGKQCVGG